MEFILSVFPVLQLPPTAFEGSNKTKAAHNKISSHSFYTRSSCSTNFLVWMFFHFFTLRTRVIFCVSGHRQFRFEQTTWSLAMFVCSHRSLHSLSSQHYASLRSVHGLAHSLRSLPRGTVEILEYMSTL